MDFVFLCTVICTLYILTFNTSTGSELFWELHCSEAFCSTEDTEQNKEFSVLRHLIPPVPISDIQIRLFQLFSQVTTRSWAKGDSTKGKLQLKAIEVVLTVFKDKYFSEVCSAQLSPYRFAYLLCR